MMPYKQFSRLRVGLFFLFSLLWGSVWLMAAPPSLGAGKPPKTPTATVTAQATAIPTRTATVGFSGARRSLYLPVVAYARTIPTPPPTVTPVPMPTTIPEGTDGYLVNGGFEGAFYPVGAGQVADGWTRVHLAGNPNWMSTQTFAGGGWVEKIEGANSQILSVENLSIGQPFDTVLYQRVMGLIPGQSYSLSGWVLKMWGGSANTLLPPPAVYGSWVGIDPTGGTDPNAASVQWASHEWQDEVKGHFENHRMAAVAQGTMITLFVRVQLKEPRAETQAIVDGWELFDAPRAAFTTPGGVLSSPQITWQGTLPPGLAQLGNYAMFYRLEQRQADGSWSVLATELRTTSYILPLSPGQSGTFRLTPYSYQPREEAPRHWPPSTHTGMPVELSVTLR